MTKEITNAPKHSFPSIGREDVAHTEEMEHKIRRTDSEVCFDFLNHLLKIKMCARTCGEGEQDSLTQRGCRQTLYIQMKGRSLNLLRTKCTEMCSDRATRPEKAASGVEDDHDPARGKQTTGLELPATARGELQEGTGHAKSETAFNRKTRACPCWGQGWGTGVPAKTPFWRSVRGVGGKEPPRGSAIATG